MICNYCKKEITEHFHIEVNAVVIKQDSSYVKGLSFTNKDKTDLTAKIQLHFSCWKELLLIKNNHLELKSFTAKDISEERIY